MKSAIKDMFAGNRGTYDHIPLSQEYEETRNKMYQRTDAFLEELTPKQKSLFHEVYECIAENSAVCAEDHFVEGFRFGLAIGIEAGARQSKD